MVQKTKRRRLNKHYSKKILFHNNHNIFHKKIRKTKKKQIIIFNGGERRSVREIIKEFFKKMFGRNPSTNEVDIVEEEVKNKPSKIREILEKLFPFFFNRKKKGENIDDKEEIDIDEEVIIVGPQSNAILGLERKNDPDTPQMFKEQIKEINFKPSNLPHDAIVEMVLPPHKETEKATLQNYIAKEYGNHEEIENNSKKFSLQANALHWQNNVYNNVMENYLKFNEYKTTHEFSEKFDEETYNQIESTIQIFEKSMNNFKIELQELSDDKKISPDEMETLINKSKKQLLSKQAEFQLRTKVGIYNFELEIETLTKEIIRTIFKKYDIDTVKKYKINKFGEEINAKLEQMHNEITSKNVNSIIINFGKKKQNYFEECFKIINEIHSLQSERLQKISKKN